MFGPERKGYHPEYFTLMNAITAMSVASWLEMLNEPSARWQDLRQPTTTSNYLNASLASGSDRILAPIHELLHLQFVTVLRTIKEQPRTDLQAATAELFNNIVCITMGQMHSKMRHSPYPMGTTTGGFGSGLLTLMTTEVLDRLYTDAYFPGFKAATALAQIDMRSFGSKAILEVGAFDNELAERFGVDDRKFTALNLEDEDATHGLDTTTLQRWGYAPNADYSGCVGLHPPSAEFRRAHDSDCPTMPTKSAIAQLRTFIVPVIDNILSWAKSKGGTRVLRGKISPIDLGFLNGTHPNLPRHPETGSTPPSLID